MSLRFTALLLIAIAATASPAIAVVDQQWLPQPDVKIAAFIGASNKIDGAQTFTVGVDGFLSGFDIWVAKDSVVTQPLLYDIRTLVAGKPTDADAGSNILASGIILPASIPLASADDSPPALPTHVDLGVASFPVAIGEMFAIVLQTNDPGTPNDAIAYRWSGSESSPQYGGGDDWVGLTGDNGIRNWSAATESDLYFRTYVRVPEPSVGILGLIIAACLALIRRR